MNTGKGSAGVDVHLAEYACLKAEQLGRVGARDAYMYSALAAAAAAAAAAAQARLPHLLLAVPAVCFVLGWTRLRNDLHIVAIRRYLRDQLAPRLHTDGPVLGWEVGPRSPLARWVQLAADAVTFVVPPVAASAAWVATATPAWWGWLAAAAGLALTGFLAALIVRHAIGSAAR